MDFVIFAVNFLFSVYYLLLAVRAVLPWIPHRRTSPFVDPVYRLTDPVLNPVRMGLPPQRIGMDVSPFAVIFLLWLLQQFIIRMLEG